MQPFLLENNIWVSENKAMSALMSMFADITDDVTQVQNKVQKKAF